MFSYCLNCPLIFADSTGTCCYIAPITYWYDCGDWRCPTSREELDTLAEYQTIPDVNTHYNRNNYNPVFPAEYEDSYFENWDDNVSANCHQFTSADKNNKKYVSQDGHYEVIYDVNYNLVLDPKDVGTYNFISPNKDPLGHFIQDVIPWLLYGNSPDVQPLAFNAF